MFTEWLDRVYILHHHHSFDGFYISKGKVYNKFLYCLNVTINLTGTSLTERLVDLVVKEYINKVCEMLQRSGRVRRNVLSAQTGEINNELKPTYSHF